jgi:beta-galactosidase
LEEKQSYDMAAVRIRILDEFGNIAPYAQLPVKLQLEGAAELVGPDVVTAEGGMTGAYIRTTGAKGTAKLTVSTPQTPSVTVTFSLA